MTAEHKKTALVLIAIGVATVVAYLPALQAGFIWDDDAYVQENQNLRSLWGLFRIWFVPLSIPQYYPLVHTTYWIEYQLWGLAPFGYHLVNLLLHLTSCVLLCVVVRRLALPGGLLAAAIFALHPVMVESVAWITERKNVLSMVFYLLSLLAYLRCAGLDGSPPPPEEERGRHRWRALVLFLLALTAKSVTFSLPFTILLLIWWKRGRVTGADVRPLVPFMLLGAAYGIATSIIEKVKVIGAEATQFTETLVQKCLIAGRVPWFYLGKLAWPQELTFIYKRWVVDPAVAWQWAFPVATVALVATLWVLRGRIGRGPLAAVLVFGGTLFPALGFIDVYPFRYAFVADHFQYHASLGVIVLVAAVLTAWVPARIGVPLAVAVLALYGVRTHRQAARYEDKEVLYDSILADLPDSWFAHNNLAAIYVQRDEFEKGFAFYRKTKELNPGLWPGPHIAPEAFAHAMVGKMMGNTHSLMPVALAVERKDVREYGRLMAELDPWQPRILAEFQKAIAINPDYVDAMIDSGKLLANWGRLASDPEKMLERWIQAIGLFERALRLDPAHRDARVRAWRLHVEISRACQGMGRSQDAQRHSARALELQREDPHLRER